MQPAALEPYARPSTPSPEQGFTAEGPKESAEALREETKEAAGQDADSLETAAGSAQDTAQQAADAHVVKALVDETMARAVETGRTAVHKHDNVTRTPVTSPDAPATIILPPPISFSQEGRSTADTAQEAAEGADETDKEEPQQAAGETSHDLQSAAAYPSFRSQQRPLASAEVSRLLGAGTAGRMPQHGAGSVAESTGPSREELGEAAQQEASRLWLEGKRHFEEAIINKTHKPVVKVKEDKATEARRVFGEALRAAEGAHLESMAAFDKYWQIKEVEREARTLCGKQAQEADPLIRAVQAKVRIWERAVQGLKGAIKMLWSQHGEDDQEDEVQKAYEKLMQGEHLVGLIKQMELEQARADKAQQEAESAWRAAEEAARHVQVKMALTEEAGEKYRQELRMG